MRTFTANDLLLHDIAQIDSLGYGIHTPVDGLDFPAIRLSSYDKPGEHGAEVSNQLYGARQVDLTGIVFGDTIVSYNERRRALQAAFRIVRNNYISLPILCKFKNDDGLDLQFYAYLKDKVKMAEEWLNHANWFVTLFAPDPNLYAQLLQTVTLALTGVGGSIYPVIYPVTYGTGGAGGSAVCTNNGDANTWPIITLSGQLTNPIITDLATNETFLFNGTIASGDTLVIDMQKKTMVLNATTNAMSGFAQTNTWLSFVPGVNTIILTTDDIADDGSLSIAFHDAYIGS